MIDLDPGWLTRLGDAGTLLAMLLVGHVLADFVVQTDEMVRRKKTWKGLTRHAALVVAVQLFFVLPYVVAPTLAILIALGLAHAAIDALKIQFQDRTRLRATWFLVDQALHFLSLAFAWILIVYQEWWVPRALPLDAPLLTRALLLVAAYAFAWNGGSAIVRELLAGRDEEGAVTPTGMGKLIGCLERWIVITLVLVSQWSAIAFVFAAKSIARFKQIEERRFAEYYLVGTLASLVVAVTIGLTIAWALGP